MKSMKATIDNHNLKSWLILFLVCAVLLLPARFYQSFSLPAFNVNSNLNVNYINAIDLFFILIALVCIVFSGRISLTKKQSYLLFTFFIIIVVCALGLIITDRAIFIGELLSKLLILFCSIIIGNYIISNFSNKQLTFLYLIPLIVLIASSFFLNNYESYGQTRRTGTIGFGSNETAMFACAFIFILLFKKDFNIFLKIVFLGLCFASLFVVASRRGILIAGIFVLIKIVSLLFLFRKKANLRKIATAFLAISVLIIFAFIFKDRIKGFLSSSALFLRFEYSLDSNNYFSLGERAAIFKEGFNYFFNHPLIGSFGSDTLYAQGNSTHTHNMFLQVFATYGFVFGLLITCFLINSFIKASIICISKSGKGNSVFIPCSFLFVTFLCEQAGYVFWNPKAFFWVAFTLVIVNEKVYNNYYLKEMNRIEKSNVVQIDKNFLYR